MDDEGGGLEWAVVSSPPGHFGGECQDRSLVGYLDVTWCRVYITRDGNPSRTPFATGITIHHAMAL